MAKEAKTNAMRMLERMKIPYEVIRYECDEFVDGLHAAKITGTPVEATLKTIVTRGKDKECFVVVIPIAEEIDLKKAAREAGEKSLEMVHVKELTALTGYVRGGCSPIGMKKHFKTLIDKSAGQFDKIYVSGGRIGVTLCMKPEDLLKACDGKMADLTQKPDETIG
jgi:Cys-tRNA(Pro)/Cys-tRNA(Cys) deacylase